MWNEEDLIINGHIDNDYNPMPVEIFISTCAEENNLTMYLPSKLRGRIDIVPEELCRSKEKGYMSCIVFLTSKLDEVLAVLYQEELPNLDFTKFRKQKISKELKIVGFWD